MVMAFPLIAIFWWLFISLTVLPNFTFMLVQKQCRCFPNDECWPSKDEWDSLNKTIDGRLRVPISPFEPCLNNVTLKEDPDSCETAVKSFKEDPFWLQTFSGATQSTGQVGAWTAMQSEYVVEASNESDIVAAVKFADRFNLRLVVKGTGHDYYGRSNAANSLLIWTHHMKNIQFHDKFLSSGCSGPAFSAVTLGAGLTWMDVYAEATDRNLYVQGGGCTSVGVVGFVIGGGYGSWSKMYGLAATNLLEATVITADGKVVVASKCQNADLFYALRGGGYGFGVVSSMTFRTFPLPTTFISTGESYVNAKNSQMFETLVTEFLYLYKTNLIGPNWGNQVRVKPVQTAEYPDGWKMEFRMVATNITKQEATEAWKPLVDWLLEHKEDYKWKIDIKAIAGKDYWTLNNPDSFKSNYNSKEPNRTFFWNGDHREVSEYWLFALNSRYLRTDQFLEDPMSGARKLMTFLKELPKLPDSIPVAIHLNKAQYGASQWAMDELKDMPLPATVKESFGLILISFGVQYYNPLVPDKFQYNTSDLHLVQSLCKTKHLDACETSQKFKNALNNFRKETPGAGSYFNQADFFEPDFQNSFWGNEIYLKLTKIKIKWDPKGLYYCHNCVGSESWEKGGMCRKNENSGAVVSTVTSVLKYFMVINVAFIFLI